jgi:riboflavin biosynthesis pyrimidine reductase
VFCSFSGDLPRGAAVFATDELPVVVATTTGGRAAAEASLAGRPNAEVVVFGDDRVDVQALERWLLAERGVRSLLCEGGPGLYGTMLADAAVDDEFVTLSPTFIGPHSSDGARRPSLVEGASFAPGATPRSLPVSLRRAGHHLLMHSRVEYPS